MNTATCGGCGRGWTGTTSAHCTACHEHFSTVKNFDAHKPSRRGCGDPRTMTRVKPSTGATVPVFKQSGRSNGVVWIGYSEDPRFAEGAAS